MNRKWKTLVQTVLFCVRVPSWVNGMYVNSIFLLLHEEVKLDQVHLILITLLLMKITSVTSVPQAHKVITNVMRGSFRFPSCSCFRPSLPGWTTTPTLTFSQVPLSLTALPDGSRPLLRLLQVISRVLQRGETKAVLHSLPWHPRTHPAPFERVEVDHEVRRRVRVIILPVGPASDTVLQAEYHLVSPHRCRGEPLNDELPLGQTHVTPNFSVTGDRELPVQRGGTVSVRFCSPLVHPERTEGTGIQQQPPSYIWPPGRCEPSGYHKTTGSLLPLPVGPVCVNCTSTTHPHSFFKIK